MKKLSLSYNYYMQILFFHIQFLINYPVIYASTN